MSRIVIFSLIAAASVTTAGCANSVLNDPEEMARRHASIDRDRARRDAFWGRFQGSPNAPGSASTTGSPGLMQISARTPRQCAAIGGTWNHGSNYCWRL
jgi:hypothetical protein